MRPGHQYDIVIVGAGPAGLTLSVCLARWGYKIKHIDNRLEPTMTGRADGIQPRSLEFLENLRLKDAIMEYKPGRFSSVAFWEPSRDGIHRKGIWPTCPESIDTRFPYTTTLAQGMVEKALITDLEKNGVHVQRPWTVSGFENDGFDSEYPLVVKVKHIEEDIYESIRTKYLIGADGARSFIRL